MVAPCSFHYKIYALDDGEKIQFGALSVWEYIRDSFQPTVALHILLWPGCMLQAMHRIEHTCIGTGYLVFKVVGHMNAVVDIFGGRSES